MRRTLISLLLGVGLSASAFAEDDERRIWACSTFNDNARPIIHLVELGDKSYVKFSNQRFRATHKADGSAHEWLWDNRRGFYNYSISLGADNIAEYFDFSGIQGGEVVPPADKFRCRQTQ
jgi:hypothetical protein